MAKKLNKEILHLFVSSIFCILVLGLSVLNIIDNKLKKVSIETPSNEITIEYWSDVIKDHPTYKDAYWEYGKELLKRGRLEEATYVFNIAKELEYIN